MEHGVLMAMEGYRGFLGLLVSALLVGFLSVLFVLIWVLHFREGLGWDGGALEFNWHPVLAVTGFVFIQGIGMGALERGGGVTTRWGPGRSREFQGIHETREGYSCRQGLRSQNPETPAARPAFELASDLLGREEGGKPKSLSSILSWHLSIPSPVLSSRAPGTSIGSVTGCSLAALHLLMWRKFLSGVLRS